MTILIRTAIIALIVSSPFMRVVSYGSVTYESPPDFGVYSGMPEDAEHENNDRHAGTKNYTSLLNNSGVVNVNEL
jgi:hypothetical protein